MRLVLSHFVEPEIHNFCPLNKIAPASRMFLDKKKP